MKSRKTNAILTKALWNNLYLLPEEWIQEQLSQFQVIEIELPFSVSAFKILIFQDVSKVRVLINGASHFMVRNQDDLKMGIEKFAERLPKLIEILTKLNIGVCKR